MDRLNFDKSFFYFIKGRKNEYILILCSGELQVSAAHKDGPRQSDFYASPNVSFAFTQSSLTVIVKVRKVLLGRELFISLQ